MDRNTQKMLRDDDVYLTESPRHGTHLYNFEKFKKAHEIIASYKIPHALAIVASEIPAYQELTEYINGRKKEFIFGLHGWTHMDYSVISESAVENSLGRAKLAVYDTFGVYPTWFFPPWNRRSDNLRTACKNLGLELCEHYAVAQYWNGENICCFHYWNDNEVALLNKICKAMSTPQS